MSKKKILLLSYFGSCHGGGTVSGLVTIAQGLRQRNYQVLLASSEAIASDCQWLRLPFIRFLPNLYWRDMVLAWWLQFIIKKYHIDLLHVCDLRFCARAGILAAKKCHLPVVIDIRDFWFCSLDGMLKVTDEQHNFRRQPLLFTPVRWHLFSPLSWLRYFWQKHKIAYFNTRLELFAAADFFLPVSQTVAKVWRQLQIKAPMKVMDEVNLEPVPQKKQQDIAKSQLKIRYQLKQEKVILFAGSLVEHQGMKMLVALARSLDNQVAKIFIAGCGKWQTYLKNQCQKYQLKNIILCGQLNRPQLQQLLWASDIFVFPTLIVEPFGRAVLEALRAGVVVVGSKVGNLPALVKDNYHGYLVPPGDEAAFVLRVQRLLSHPERLAAFSHHCLATWSKNSSDIFFTNLINVYQQVESQDEKV